MLISGDTVDRDSFHEYTDDNYDLKMDDSAIGDDSVGKNVDSDYDLAIEVSKMQTKKQTFFIILR